MTRMTRIMPRGILIFASAMVIVLTALVTVSAACEQSTIKDSSTSTPTGTLSIYDLDINTVESAIAEYYADQGQWPTADGDTGDIDWNKLVPDYLAAIPSTDTKCDWYIDDDPLGEVCRHGCSPCGCPGGKACE